MLKVRKELQGLAPCAHGGKLEEIARKAGVKERDLLDFSVNLNPYAPPDIRELMLKLWDCHSKYPDNAYSRFCGSAAKFAGVRLENIIPGNGSTEIIRLFAEAVIEKGDIVAIPCPTFGEYEQQCRLFGANMRYIRYSDLLKDEYWHLDGCKATFLCNPNNPDGRMVSARQVLDIAAYCEKNDIILVVDEAFIDLSDPSQSVAGMVDRFDNLFVMRSLTKCFSIPGFRLGFGIARPDTAAVFNSARLTWNLDNVSAEVGIHYMDSADGYLDVSRAYIKREREWLMEKISEIGGLKPVPSPVNYFLVDVAGTGMTSREFSDKMQKEKVIVRDCGSFKMLGETYIRLAVRPRLENERLVKALKNVAGGTR